MNYNDKKIMIFATLFFTQKKKLQPPSPPQKKQKLVGDNLISMTELYKVICRLSVSGVIYSTVYDSWRGGG